MNLFQIASLSALAVALVREQSLARRGLIRGPVVAVRVLAMLAAAAAIAWPHLTQVVANFLGIGRGADALLYVSALALLFLSLYFYARSVQQQRRLTSIVRHLAILEAQRGGAEVGDDIR